MFLWHLGEQIYWQNVRKGSLIQEQITALTILCQDVPQITFWRIHRTEAAMFCQKVLTCERCFMKNCASFRWEYKYLSARFNKILELIINSHSCILIEMSIFCERIFCKSFLLYHVFSAIFVIHYVCVRWILASKWQTFWMYTFWSSQNVTFSLCLSVCLSISLCHFHVVMRFFCCHKYEYKMKQFHDLNISNSHVSTGRKFVCFQWSIQLHSREISLSSYLVEIVERERERIALKTAFPHPWQQTSWQICFHHFCAAFPKLKWKLITFIVRYMQLYSINWKCSCIFYTHTLYSAAF